MHNKVKCSKIAITLDQLDRAVAMAEQSTLVCM